MKQFSLLLLVFGVVGCHQPSTFTPTIGQVCTIEVAAEYETYLKNNLTCVEMHKAMTDDEMNNWTIVYIVGLEKSAAFEKQSDAEAWARSQPYVRQPSQVR